MNPFVYVLLILASLLLAATFAIVVQMRRRHMQQWLGAYAFPAERRTAWERDVPTAVFIALCDHWEPLCYDATHEQAQHRIRRWVTEYPRLFGDFRDCTGRPPQHTFFYPQDEYRPEYLDLLKPLCEAGYGDVDVHLHHDNDTADGLRDKLESFRQTLYHRHGFLRKNERGEIVYGFIHGNWSLCNSRPDGRMCGVDQELTVLMETGCYADFTLPAVPSPAQTRTINSIYYAKDILGQCKSHDRGIRATVGRCAPADHLLMIQGPLGLDWQQRKWGIMPRTENGDVHGAWPADMARFHNWLNAGVCVAGRPEWRFIKLHAHGCKDSNIDTLLGPAMQSFHAGLADLQRANSNLKVYYVTAWEMAQLVHQAERGSTTPVIARSAPALPAYR